MLGRARRTDGLAEENLPTEEKVRRSAGRTVRRGLLLSVVLAVLILWGSLGVYTLEPGSAAVILRFGEHVDTVTQEGLNVTLPPPLNERLVVDVDNIRNEDFGFRGKEGEQTPRQQILEATMQTSDNNIVRVGFAVQYKIKDAFAWHFRVADADAVVRDAAQAAVREVVGRMTVDGVLRERRAELTSASRRLLQDVLDSYDSGILVQSVQAQNVQPPAPVVGAFEDVLNANQNASQLVNEAEGYRNQLIPGARAEAAELIAAANGYREATIAEATGAAERFKAIAVEHRKAPVVTEKRLFLEAMEEVLPSVEKVIVEGGTTNVLPYLPLDQASRRAR